MISLNLLPPERRKLYARSIIFDRWKRAMFILVIGCIAVNAGVLATTTILQTRRHQSEKEFLTLSNEVDQSDVGTIRRSITTLDETRSMLAQAIPNNRPWSAQMTKLLASLPSGISISELNWNAAGQITLTGVAQLRANFIALDEALKKNSNLENVQTSSQASKRDQLPFVYTAQWKNL